MVYFDAVVIGLGVTGSAALRSLAKRGRRVLGIDRYPPAHEFGSSHGESRIIRLGYYEHPSYVPLVREALSLWRALEAETGKALLTTTGIVEFGSPDSELIAGTLASSRLHRLPHEVMDARAAMERFPALRLPPDCIAVFQPDAGVLAAEMALAAQIGSAMSAGADIKIGCTVLKIARGPRGIRLATSDGTIDAGKAIVAAGAWLPHLMPELRLPLRVTRQVMAWFAPGDTGGFEGRQFPVFLAQTGHGIHYGFPAGPHGVKVCKHFHLDEDTTPAAIERTVSPRDTAAIRAFLADHLPALDRTPARAKTCLYTMTSDGDFILDRVPNDLDVIVASACSGHGFKFAPAIGEILADLATGETPRHDISRFRLSRFA